MKKNRILAFLLSALLLFSALPLSAYAAGENALPLSAGLEALQGQFVKGVGPENNGYTLDYRYYSPVENGKSGKYPLVIWLHGMSEGAYEGKQVINNNIAYWTSAEFQARFSPDGGAYILAPRSLEEKMIFWDDSMVEPLRATIDDFIAKNRDTIDVTRIYIGGFSMGGKMTLKMSAAYPEMFAAAFPICPAWNIDEENAANLHGLPIWLTSGVLDPLVNYYTSVTPTWKKIIAQSDDPAACRFSTLSKVCYPDGSRTSSSHHAWFAVNYDMFSIDNGDYPYMSTVDGTGKTVKLTYPNGMISWLSQFTSDYDGTPIAGTGSLVLPDDVHNVFSFETILDFFDTVMDILNEIILTLREAFAAF